MNPAEITTLAVAAGALVTTVGAVAVKIIAALSDAARQRQAQTDKIDETLRKTAVIEGHVNSEKTRAEGEIAALKTEIAVLRETMADQKEAAALLAQSAVQAAVLAAPPIRPVEGRPVEGKLAESTTLKKIEKHTKETAANTAATDVTVQQIKKDNA